MDPDFWHQRWSDNKIGFHQQKINSRLIKHFNRTGVQPGDKVFVPLCGKSQDLIWLRQQGLCVLGIELSELACRQFFIEHDIEFESRTEPRFRRLTADGIELLAGDFFALEKSDLSGIRAVYDRAALIALPEPMRLDYSRHLSQLIEPGVSIFLIGIDYDERKMNGPPFSVPESEVRQLFAAEFAIDIVTQSSGPDIVGNLAERGLDTLNEKVYLLTRTR